jgi:tetratricopeptide (TPR) repeat protein
LVAAAAGADVVFRHAPTGSASVNQKTLQEVEIGHFFLNKVSREDTFKAIEHFQAAVRENADYAPAHAGLADSYNQLATVFVAGKPPGNVRLLAKRAATRAIQLDPNLPDPYVALGNAAMHELDWSQAEKSYLRAIQLNPRYAVAHQLYGSLLVAQRRFSEAIAQARLAVDLSPVSLRARENLAWMLYFNREYESAIRELHAIVEMDRTFARAHWRLGQVLLVQEKYDEAVGFLEKAVQLSDRAPAALGLLAMGYGGLGQIDAAQRLVDELAERAGKETVPPGASLLGYLGVKDTSAALDALERVYEEGDGYAMFVDADPLMDSLRTEPRFQAICSRIMLGSASHATLVRQ